MNDWQRSYFNTLKSIRFSSNDETIHYIVHERLNHPIESFTNEESNFHYNLIIVSLMITDSFTSAKKCSRRDTVNHSINESFTKVIKKRQTVRLIQIVETLNVKSCHHLIPMQYYSTE